MRPLKSIPHLLILAGSLLLFQTGCQIAGKPNAAIEVNELSAEVKNLDQTAYWKACTMVLNPSAGVDEQYSYPLGDIGPQESISVFLARFTKKDGKRFIPILTKTSEAKLQCQQPILPVTVNVS